MEKAIFFPSGNNEKLRICMSIWLEIKSVACEREKKIVLHPVPMQILTDFTDKCQRETCQNCFAAIPFFYIIMKG